MPDPVQTHDTGVAITTSAPGMITLRGALEDTAFKAAVEEVSGLTVPEPVSYTHLTLPTSDLV